MAALLDEKKSLLVTIDIQEKLIPTIDNAQMLIENNIKLLKAAKIINIPIILTEHFPEKLGLTPSLIRDFFDSTDIISKTVMSCCGAPNFVKKIQDSGKEHIILTGIETHVCVLQTAIELHQMGKQVFIVADAVSSRSFQSVKLAIKRLRDFNIDILNLEMVIFEWIRNGNHPHFKSLIQLIK